MKLYNISADGGKTYTTQWLTAEEATEEGKLFTVWQKNTTRKAIDSPGSGEKGETMAATKVKFEKHRKSFAKEVNATSFCKQKQQEGYYIDFCLPIDGKWRIFYWRIIAE